MAALILIIVITLIFDVINGFHDAANSIATVVTTRVLSPNFAVLWAAFFNFISYLVVGLHVANTVGKGIVHLEVVTLPVLFAAVIGAICWNLLTWWFGIPSSSSHTLMGGFVGAAIVHAGFQAVYYLQILKIVAFIFLAPLIGMVIAVAFGALMINVVKKLSPYKVDDYFRKFQLLSAASYSLGHGANDAQKSMGIIFVALIITGKLASSDTIPFWVVISCHAAMALGTMMGGWRIVKTMGQKISQLRPFEGFCAETAGACALFMTSALGIPVSTTHTITGSIVGIGMVRKAYAVKWGMTREIVIAWVITIPATAMISSLIYYLVSYIKFLQ